MKKILDKLGFAIVILGLSLGYVIIVGEIGHSDPIMIFVILPTPYFVAIWEYLHIKQKKQAYKTAHELYDKEIADLDKQVNNYKILNNVRIANSDILKQEITELKSELASTVKKPIILATSGDGKTKPPFIEVVKGTIFLATRNQLSVAGQKRSIKGHKYLVKEILEDGMYLMDDELSVDNQWLPINELAGLFIITKPDTPFTGDKHDKEIIFICPECNKPMERMTNKIVFCDNIKCTRKQFRKDKL